MRLCRLDGHRDQEQDGTGFSTGEKNQGEDVVPAGRSSSSWVGSANILFVGGRSSDLARRGRSFHRIVGQLMKLSLQSKATVFPQPGFFYGFAVHSEARPGLWLHVLTPAIRAGRADPVYRKGTILAYAIDHTGKGMFTPKEMPRPSWEMISALRDQWSDLSAAHIRLATERLDDFEESEGITDYDSRSAIDCTGLSFAAAEAFFTAPDFVIAPAPVPGGMGYLVSAVPLPSS